MKKLPKKFKEKWIAALRSGKYKQGKFILYDKETDTFCCLGIAGFICGISKKSLDGKTYLGCDYNSHITNNAIPEDLQSKNYSIADERKRAYGIVSMMNDEGKSFLEIADWIEKNL